MLENKDENISSNSAINARKSARRPYSRKRDVRENSNEQEKRTQMRVGTKEESNEMTNKSGRKRTARKENFREVRFESSEENKAMAVRQTAFLKETSNQRALQEVPNQKALQELPNQKSLQEVSNQKELQEMPNQKSTKKRVEGFGFKLPRLKIIPLGGLHEVGKNITIFEYDDEMIVVDCGLSFPDDDMLGVDIVIPDITYIVKNQNKLKGLVITHGHEDHIGGIPYFLKQVNTPIYGTKLTLGLIKNKLEEHNLTSSTVLNEVSPGQTIKLGRRFKVEFIQSSHSIPDSVMFAITTPVGTVIHTGDFKVDFTPMDGKIMDFGRLAELGNKGVLALMSDSTNAERKGFTMSESTVGDVFEKLFTNCKKRIVVATFASNVHRVQQIVNSAVKYGRKIAVCGRSMINMITTARELGYIECPDNIFIDIDMINNYTDDKLLIITTGSQGETMSALTRMASGTHRKVKITPNDLVIISANPIPGNEKSVSKVIDSLMQIGAEVVYSALEDVHVSGHACQEEQKLIIALTKPKYFIPVHGEYRHLIAHSETAKSMGIPRENIFKLENGRVLEIDKKSAEFTTTVQSGNILVDGLGVGDVGNVVLRDRQHLSQDGLIIVVLTMDNSGQVVAGPDVISRGFVYVKENGNVMDDIKNAVRNEVRRCEYQGISDWTTIKNSIRENLKDYIFAKTKRNPMIIPIVMEV